MSTSEDQATSDEDHEEKSPIQRTQQNSDNESDVQQTAESPASDSSVPAAGSPTQEDLFGDADDVRTSSDEDAETNRSNQIARPLATNRSPAAEGESPEHGDDDDMDDKQADEAAPVEETILNAEIPKINVDLGNQIHFVKFPNFLSVEPRPFDSETYEDEVDEDEVLDEEGRSRLKLKVENTIRWRFALDEDGNLTKDSNAKVVRWSDGSMSLYLGSEVFDVHTHPLQGDHHHLFIRQGTGLQGRSVFRTKLTFRPHSTDSFTHRKMTLSMADKTNKAQKVKVLPAVGKNPEALKQELIKKEEERMRASARRENQQRRMRERTHGSGGRALSAAFLEPDRSGEWEEGDVSLSAIKNRFKTGAKDAMRGNRRFSDEDEDEEEEEEVSDLDSSSEQRKSSSSSKQTSIAKRIIESDEEEEDTKAGTSDGKRRQANVINESDDDDD